MGIVAAVHAAASYRVSRFCGRDSHAGGRAMIAATEAGGTGGGEAGDGASPSAVYLISYLNEAKCRPRIAHLRRSPISSTILSTLTMAYEEYVFGIQADWVAH